MSREMKVGETLKRLGPLRRFTKAEDAQIGRMKERNTVLPHVDDSYSWNHSENSPHDY